MSVIFSGGRPRGGSGFFGSACAAPTCCAPIPARPAAAPEDRESQCAERRVDPCSSSFRTSPGEEANPGGVEYAGFEANLACGASPAIVWRRTTDRPLPRLGKKFAGILRLLDRRSRRGTSTIAAKA